MNPLDGAGFLRRDLLKGLLGVGAGAALATLPGALAWAADTALDEEGAYRLGKEAYVYGYPLIYFARMRYSRLMQGDPMTHKPQLWAQWQHRNVPVTPALPGAPQTDCLYSGVWLDMRKEPYVFSVPKMDERYWSIQFCDLFGTTFGLPGHRDLPKGGRIAVVGPDWKGQLPANIDLTLRAEMPQAFIVMRMFFADEMDRAKANALQQQFGIAPLSAFVAGRDAVPGVAGHEAPLPEVGADPLADFKVLQAMWQQCPPPAKDAALVARFAAIGLAAGAHGFDSLPEPARKGLQRAEKDARQQVVDASHALSGKRTANGWTEPRPRLGYYDDNDYLYRASVALAGTIAVPIAENPYYVLQRDASGQMLSGDGRYELHFAADQIPQAEAFWSMHAYNSHYTVIDNPIHRYSFGDRSQGLKYGADGSLVIYLQADDPGAEKTANWLPTHKGDSFWLMIRAYEPKGAMKALQWQGPRLVKLS